MPGDFDFHDLTKETRESMIHEINDDILNDGLFMSVRFTASGRDRYPNLLLEASREHDESWLKAHLDSFDAFLAQELKAGKLQKVPSNACQLFAQSEFNRFYIRGLCRLAIERGVQELRIYRARQSSNPRPESEQKIGQFAGPAIVLNDLRSRIGTSSQFGLPEVNSGLSLEFVR